MSATLQLLDTVDQTLPEATGERVLCFLVVLITRVGHQDIFNFEKNIFFQLLNSIMFCFMSGASYCCMDIRYALGFSPSEVARTL